MGLRYYCQYGFSNLAVVNERRIGLAIGLTQKDQMGWLVGVLRNPA